MQKVLRRGQCFAGALLKRSYSKSYSYNVRYVAPSSPPVVSDVPAETPKFQDLPETITDSTWTCPKGENATAQAVRKAMRKLPHPVVIVTACRESSSPVPPEPIDPKQDNVELLSPYYQDFCGATISSLQTVTLGPPAMISFNLKMPSRTLSGLLHHKHFGVHILLGKLAGVYIADAFLQQSHNEAFRALTRRGLWVGLGLGPGQSRVDNPEKNIPLIRGQGVVSFMRCEVIPDKCVVVGDHMVVIAKVATIGLSPSRGDNQHYSSLAYQKGKYGGTFNAITGYDPAKPLPDHKIPGPVWQIKKNNLGVHNDSLALIDGGLNKAKD